MGSLHNQEVVGEHGGVVRARAEEWWGWGFGCFALKNG